MKKSPTLLCNGFHAPVGMAFDSSGNLFVANWGAGTISRLTPTGKLSTFVSGQNGPSGLAIDTDDNLYVASYSDNIVQRITPAGTLSIFVDNLATPAGLSFDRNGNLLIANRATNEILAANSNGEITVVAKGLRTPVGAAQTKDECYIVSNINGGITLVEPNGCTREINNDFAQPGPGIVINKHEEVFVVDYGGTCVRNVTRDGNATIVADGLKSPAGLTIDGKGQLFVGAWGDDAVYRID